MSSSLTNKKGKGIVRAGTGNNKGKGILRAGFGNKKRMGFLMPPNPLTNFKIQKYYKNEPIFNGVFSRNNLQKKIKDEAYIIDLDECANVDTHWIALFSKKNKIVYFDSFGVEYIPKEIKDFIEEFPGNKNIKTNIFRIEEDNSIMCGYFCVGFIDFMLAGKKLTDYVIEEINQRKSCSQKLDKYVTTFDYIDKILIVLSATTGGVSII